jgi:tripartite-type tricarboxylate transporter receptor subunit TctC
MRQTLCSALAAFLMLSVIGADDEAAAQRAYPERPVTLLVPAAAGGPSDTVARLIADSMSKSLGQQFVVENMGGAGGSLGAGKVAKADPDGYTLLLYHIGVTTFAALYPTLPYKPAEAFTSVGLVTEVPMTLVGRSDLPPGSVAELIAYLKAQNGMVTFGTAGVGAVSHLCGILLQQATGAKLTTVPYKGTGPAMTDLLGGQVDFMCDQTTNTTNQIKAGKIKAYATTTAKRLAALPDVPTAEEAGLPGFQVGIWHGLYAPKGTPKEVVDRLVTALNKALTDENVKARFAELGTEPVAAADATPAGLKAKLESEIARWAPVIKAAGQYAD